MSDADNIFQRIRSRGNEVFQQLSNELMANEHFVKAVQGAIRGKEKLDEAVGRALKTLNVPTRTELKKVQARLEAIEAELAGLRRAKAKASRKSRK